MVLWVFGYGSLIWNPGFDFDEKILGFIKGYKRTFNLACIDHRGTPSHPARTCTLESQEEAICWGIAYCVDGGLEKEREAMQYLERRECEYDQKISVNFYKEMAPFLCYVVYIGRVPGVYERWQDCHMQVNGFPGNRYKGYMSRAVAEENWRNHLRQQNRTRTRTNFIVTTTTFFFVVACVFYFFTSRA